MEATNDEEFRQNTVLQFNEFLSEIQEIIRASSFILRRLLSRPWQLLIGSELFLHRVKYFAGFIIVFLNHGHLCSGDADGGINRAFSSNYQLSIIQLSIIHYSIIN